MSGIESAWLWLLAAGCLEVGWAVGLKTTQGFTRPMESAFTLVCLVFSFLFLARAVRVLPVGTAYAVWTGIGVLGTALFGVLLFQEPLTASRGLCIALIAAGIFGLRFFG